MRTITIKGRTGRFDTPSFLLTENEDLKINIVFDKETNGKYKLSCKHGSAGQKTFLVEDKPIKLPASWIKQGGTEPIEFYLAYYNANGTTKIKDDYLIEPLLIVSENADYGATAYLQALENRLKDLENAIIAERAERVELSERFDEYLNDGIPVDKLIKEE